jgi:MFS family permease
MRRLWPQGGIYRGWWIVATGYIAQMGTVGATGWVFGVLILPMQEDLGWSRSVLVGVVTLARLLSGVFAMRIGPVVDRHGARLLMTLSALVAFVACIGTALSQNVWQYYLCWVLFGLAIPGLGTLGPAVAISNWFIRRRAQALMYFTLGSAGAGLVLAPLMSRIAADISWRWSWVGMGLIFLTVAPMAWTWVRHRPEDVGLKPDGGDTSREVSVGARDAASTDDDWTAAEALHSRSFWLVAIGFMLTSFPGSSIFIHMSSFVQSKGFSLSEGALAVSFYGAGTLIGRFTWGYLIPRLGVHRSLVLYGIGYGLSILLFVAPHSLPPIYATTILLGIAISGSQQMNVQAYADYFGRTNLGALLGYAQLMASITGAAAPLIAAAAFDTTESYSIVFSVWGAFAIVAGVCFIFSKPARRSVPQPVMA